MYRLSKMLIVTATKTVDNDVIVGADDDTDDFDAAAYHIFPCDKRALFIETKILPHIFYFSTRISNVMFLKIRSLFLYKDKQKRVLFR
jgi:hypothetical protein